MPLAQIVAVQDWLRAAKGTMDRRKSAAKLPAARANAERWFG